MCGIAGIVGPRAGFQEELIAAMCRVQAHRGPDGDGFFSEDGVMLGHRRLAILDLSPGGRQPMTTPDGRYTIVYNGELYNYLELRERLGGRAQFRTDSDTEVVLEAYAHWGTACLNEFVGMFAFAIWDGMERLLFCARDRFGIKPFYYTRVGEDFIFASEIKGLLQTRVPRRPDLGTIADYLRWNYYEHTSRTFFEGIEALAVGYYLYVRPGGEVRNHRYYYLPDQVAPAQGEVDELAAELYRRLQASIRIHLRSDVPIGVNLSGGLDSSTMLALLYRTPERPARMEAFSQDYHDPRYSERPWVEEMAKATGYHISFTYLEAGQFWQALPGMVWHEEEPFAGVPTAGYIGVYQAAGARGVTVLLDGNGLDEQLAGYRYYHPVFLARLAKRGATARLATELAAYADHWGIGRRRARQDLNLALANDMHGLATDLSVPVQGDCISPELVDIAAGPPEFAAPFKDDLRDLMYRDLCLAKVPRSLRFNDRISMAFSKELRVPFLDHRLVEFTFGLPEELLILNGTPKYLLRHAMRGLLPDRVRTASKRSIQTPQREWLQHQLAEPVRDLLGSRSFAERGIFCPERVLAEWERFRAFPAETSFHVWQWINMELWFRTFIDPPAPPLPAPRWPACAVQGIRL